MIEQIEALMEQGQWDEASAMLTDFVARHPENHTGHAYLGIAIERKGDLQAAAVQYQRAWALEPHYWQAARKLFFCLDKLGRTREALDVAREVHKLRPSDHEVELGIERLEDVLEQSRPKPAGMAWGI